MASNLPIKVVDLSPFFATDASKESISKCVETLAAACTKDGMFYLDGHQMPQELMDAAMNKSKEFFALPLETKQEVSWQHGDMARGYITKYEEITDGERDALESFDVYKPITVSDLATTESDILMGENRWPSKPAGFKRTLDEYSTHMLKLGAVLMRAMELALKHTLGLPLDYEDPDTFVFQEKTKNSFYNMRAVSYPPLSGEEESDSSELSSCGAHTDYGCVTILATDDKKGALQMSAPHGQWVDIDPVPGMFVINVADMMETWTNGLWKSPKHQVMYKHGESNRISIPFFFDPSLDSMVSPLPKCVEHTGGSKQYKSVLYGDFLRRKVVNNFGKEGHEDLIAEGKQAGEIKKQATEGQAARTHEGQAVAA